MRETPFSKIRNLGGKLGNEVVEDLSIQNASELWYELKASVDCATAFKLTCCRDHCMESLQKRFGESTGAFLYNICRGIDHEEGNF